MTNETPTIKPVTRQPTDKYKYILTFVITAIIFGVMLYVNNVLDNKRVADVQAVQDQISLDLLSSETQFDLLKESSCKNVSDSILSSELNSLATKLSYMESESNGNPTDELLYVKKNYSLLEIKDFILMEQLNQKCNSKPISILYFYGDKTDCTECENMSYVLTYLREQYPELRIYSFDTNLDLSAVDTLKSIYNIDATRLPAFVVKDNTYVGSRLAQIDKENASTTKAPSAPATSTTSTTL